jgi:hypothetical protein
VPVGKLVAYGLTAHLHGEASKQVSGVPDRKGPKWSDPN